MFIGDAGPAKIIRMKDALEEILDSSVDSVLMCDLGLLSRLDSRIFTTIGKERPLTDESALIV